MKKRCFFAALFILLLAVEVLLALYVHDSFVRPYIGDVLVVMVIYAFVRIFVPEKCKLLSLYIFLFAAFVEVLQYFNLVEVLGLQGNRFMKVLLGSTFDVSDIICYGVGSLILFVAEFAARAVSLKKTA